ncbi:putative late blight resistance protein homolog R1B-17 [Nicotiana tabacum]|uniref:Late blight resistance protein homolog R1B-17 n=1 Tax=Nicotiana tabacum TaxID=4097 RepID=A0AC58TGA9_TOBAC
MRWPLCKYETRICEPDLANAKSADLIHQVSFSAIRKKIDNLAKSSAAMTEEQLDFLLLNLQHLSKYCVEKCYPLVTEYEILHIVCGNIRDFHRLKMNGCVEHEIIKNVLPQFQQMAERVGCFLLYGELIDRDYGLSKPTHTLLKVIPFEVEVIHICHTNLKYSTSAEVGCFIEQLLETSPDILREYLIHLQENMVNVITTRTSGARNIHVKIEFLLMVLINMPKEFIHYNKLFDLLAHVGELIREVSTLVRDLEENSRNEESTNEKNHVTLDLIETIELMKGDLKHLYLKAPDTSLKFFPMSDGPLFIHLLLIHLNDLLNSNAYSVALIKEEIGLVKEDLELIRSIFVNVEQELYKDLWARVSDLAYEAKDVIDSIIVRDNDLLLLIFSLPFVIEKIKLIKEKISNLLEKILKNKCLIIVNSLTKHVERKPLKTDQLIVGFKEETYLIISKLTSGLKMLDVISITSIPGSGKTTLAYKVYNDKSVSSHFDIRAWCTVDTKYVEKKLLENIFNQVTGSTLKVIENIDVADELRKNLFRKRFLIVLDDLWDTATLDELARPFPEARKGSRIILATRDKKVALHAQCHSDPLDLRSLRQEESLELLQKRVFGKESLPDELLDVGKRVVKNCKGLPLVVHLIAGVVARKENKKSVWLEVLNSLHSFIFQKEEDVMKAIALSYDHLPDHVNPCLLDLASYEKDTKIPADHMKRLWRAKGFVEHTETNNVEEVMDVYLENLISSSLVISFNEIGNGRTYQIHDLVHHFCLLKAREEKLFDEISSNALSSSSSSDLMPREMQFLYDDEDFGHNDFVIFDSKKKRHSGKHLYSLLIYGHELDNSLYNICHLRHLRFLRVLELYGSFIKVDDYLLNEICTLVHLRFLNIKTKIKSLPSTFLNFWNLKILKVKNDGSPLILLLTIWNLVKLQVLVINDCSFFDLDTDKPIKVAEDSKLENLRELWGFKLSYSKDIKDIFILPKGILPFYQKAIFYNI